MRIDLSQTSANGERPMRPDLSDFSDWHESYAVEYAEMFGFLAKLAIVSAPIVYVIASICVHGRW